MLCQLLGKHDQALHNVQSFLGDLRRQVESRPASEKAEIPYELLMTLMLLRDQTCTTLDCQQRCRVTSKDFIATIKTLV